MVPSQLDTCVQGLWSIFLFIDCLSLGSELNKASKFALRHSHHVILWDDKSLNNTSWIIVKTY